MTESSFGHTNFEHLKGPALLAAAAMVLAAAMALTDLLFFRSLLRLMPLRIFDGVKILEAIALFGFFVVFHRWLAGRASANNLKWSAIIASIAACLGTFLAPSYLSVIVLHKLLSLGIWFVVGLAPDLLRVFFFGILARILDLRNRLIGGISAALGIVFLIRAAYAVYLPARWIVLWTDGRTLRISLLPSCLRLFDHLVALVVSLALALFFSGVWKASRRVPAPAGVLSS